MEAKVSTKSHLLTSALPFLLFSLVAIAAAPTNKTSSSYYKNYLKTACNSTRYPKVCYKSLYSYYSIIKANDLTLCTTALNVSIQATANTSASLYVLSEQQGLSDTEVEVIQDCLNEIGDSIDELNQSLNAMCSLNFNSSDVRFQISNIKTWVSAAITDEDTCTDGFDGTKVRSSMKKKIRKLISNLAWITSNALAVINNKLNI